MEIINLDLITFGDTTPPDPDGGGGGWGFPSGGAGCNHVSSPPSNPGGGGCSPVNIDICFCGINPVGCGCFGAININIRP